MEEIGDDDRHAAATRRAAHHVDGRHEVTFGTVLRSRMQRREYRAVGGLRCRRRRDADDAVLGFQSAKSGDGLEELGSFLFRALEVVRVYTKTPGKPADDDKPFTCQ